MYVIKDYISLNMLRRRDTMVILCFLLLSLEFKYTVYGRGGGLEGGGQLGHL